MSQIYAIREDDGSRVLIAVQCDQCGAEIKPHPEIAESGWMKTGQDNGPGTDKTTWDWCQDCYDP